VRAWFEVGLACADQEVPLAVRAKGLFGLTLMLSLLAENSHAEAIGQQAIACCREAGQVDRLALLGVVLAQTTLARGDVKCARRERLAPTAHSGALPGGRSSL